MNQHVYYTLFFLFVSLKIIIGFHENDYFIKIKNYFTNTVDYDVENNTYSIRYFDLVRTIPHAPLLPPD